MEANFDGLVGQTHNYAGLSVGNRASTVHAGGASHPKSAAQQGLAKMYALSKQGLAQGLLLPHERPHFESLRKLGFSGSEPAMIAAAWKASPTLVAQLYSASPMWVANAATVSPSADTSDGRVHFTPANLSSKFHRSIEAETTASILRAVFSSPTHFVHHPPLPGHSHFGDEGAANFMRLTAAHTAPGIEAMVYGAQALAAEAFRPSKFPARQSLEACQAVARLHGLAPSRTRFLQQTPALIDQGVFHNDVIAVANGTTLFVHEDAFVEQAAHLDWFGEQVVGFTALVVPREEVSVEAAIQSYLFNSQLLTLPGGSTLLVAAEQCAEEPSVSRYLERIVGKSPIDDVQYFDLRESMKNGGGPACLRLRVVLTEEERSAVAPGVWINDETYPKFVEWVETHYRDELRPDDLSDPSLIQEVRCALDELTQLTQLGSIYPFQKVSSATL